MRVARRRQAARPSRCGPWGTTTRRRARSSAFARCRRTAFRQSEIAAFAPPPADGRRRRAAPAEMTVAFLGLTGPDGRLAASLHADGHRPAAAEGSHAARLSRPVQSPDRFAVLPRVGKAPRAAAAGARPGRGARRPVHARACSASWAWGAPALRDRLEAPDELLLLLLRACSPTTRGIRCRSSGCSPSGSACRSSSMQFHGQWLDLEPAEQTAMPDATRPDGLELPTRRRRRLPASACGASKASSACGWAR